MLTRDFGVHVIMMPSIMAMLMVDTSLAASREPVHQVSRTRSIGRYGLEIPLTSEDLVKAAQEGNLEGVKYLVENGADPNFRDGEPLYNAAKFGHAEVVKYLIDFCDKPEDTDDGCEFSRAVLTAAVSNNNLDIMDLLLEAVGRTIHGSPKIPGLPLQEAAEKGYLEAVQKLLEAGYHPGGDQSITRAIKNGHVEVVKALVKAGIAVNLGYGYMIMDAFIQGHPEIARVIIKADFTPGNLDKALWKVTCFGQLDALKLLLEEGANSNHREVLRIAAMKGHLEVVRALLEAGSIIKYKETDGYPLHYAAVHGYADIIALLVEYGGDINRAMEPLRENPWEKLPYYSDIKDDANGWAVMHVAVRFGYPITQKLLDLGADINLQDAKGRTPLQIAIQYDKSIIAKELLRYCAELTLTNVEGKSALDMANDQPLKNSSYFSQYCPTPTPFLTGLLPEELATTPANEEAAFDLAKEFLVRLDANSTLKESPSFVQLCLLRLFEERARRDIVQIVEDHTCRASLHEQSIVALGTGYLARCHCVPGQGPEMTFSPIQTTNLGETIPVRC